MKTSRKIQASRKSKIPKSRMLNASRKSKALKTQKGGSAEMFDSILILPLLESYPEVRSLIQKIFVGDKLKYFKLDGSLPDPFITKANEPEFTPLFYLEWYKSKNPEFKTHDEMEREGIDFNTNIGLDGSGDSIYETVMAQICRDILIMLKTGNRNMNNNAKDPLTFFEKEQIRILTTIKGLENSDNNTKTKPLYKKAYDRSQRKLPIVEKALQLLQKSNKTTENTMEINSAKNSLYLQTEKDLKIDSLDKLYELLIQCKQCISDGYKYRDVFEIIMNYILWLCTRSKPGRDFNLETLLEYSAQLKNTPFLIFPTYAQISYNYVLNLIAAPIINFRLVNRKRAIHDNMGNSFEELSHDIMGHGDNTHRLNILVSDTKTWFENMSIVISILYPYFNYKKLPIGEKKITELGSKNYDDLNDEYKKQIIAIILFIFLHENYRHHYFYHLFLEVNPTVKIISITMEDDWPKNINAESAILALKAIYDSHRAQLSEPMKNLVDILKAKKVF